MVLKRLNVKICKIVYIEFNYDIYYIFLEKYFGTFIEKCYVIAIILAEISNFWHFSKIYFILDISP